jgi:uncharacterized protein YjbI with pentapeptide repeats
MFRELISGGSRLSNAGLKAVIFRGPVFKTPRLPTVLFQIAGLQAATLKMPSLKTAGPTARSSRTAASRKALFKRVVCYANFSKASWEDCRISACDFKEAFITEARFKKQRCPK